jgi:D-proline reductase (dithiol) PrdB
MLNKLKITTSLIKRHYPDFQFKTFNNTPVTPLTKPLNKCKLALITTGGLHLRTDIPFDLNIREGDCSYRILPGDVIQKEIAVSHKWYNHKFISSDLNCVFPIDRMREYVKKGTIKSLSEEHYSFMGHIYNTAPLIKNVKKVGKRLKGIGVDIAFITPT